MSYIRTGLDYETIMEIGNGGELSNINPSRFINESPVYDNETVMNKISHKLEEEFQDMMNKRISYEDFDYTVYMNKNIQVNKDVKKELERLYKESKKEQIKYHSTKNFYDVNGEKDSASERTQKLVEYFKIEAFKICNNEDELCNAIVEICYSKKNSSKQFAWSVCGKTMLKNLYNNTGNKQYIITKDSDGELEYVGKKYKVEVVSE